MHRETKFEPNNLRAHHRTALMYSSVPVEGKEEKEEEEEDDDNEKKELTSPNKYLFRSQRKDIYLYTFYDIVCFFGVI